MNIESVYIIYSADVLADSPRFIEEMSPAHHLPAGYPEGEERDKRAAVAEKFVRTEGDEQYDYDYLASELDNPRWRPYKPGSEDDEPGQGQHRKWVAELSFEEWQLFADAYCIDLTDEGLPEEYEETMGSLTIEYGHIDAVAVSMREGWESPGCPGSVIDAQAYVSFAVEGPEIPEPKDTETVDVSGEVL